MTDQNEFGGLLVPNELHGLESALESIGGLVSIPVEMPILSQEEYDKATKCFGESPMASAYHWFFLIEEINSYNAIPPDWLKNHLAEEISFEPLPSNPECSIDPIPDCIVEAKP